MNIDWNTTLTLWANVVFAALAISQLFVFYSKLDQMYNSRVMKDIRSIKEEIAILNDSIDPVAKLANLDQTKIQEIKERLSELTPVIEQIQANLENSDTVSNTDVIAITVEFNKIVEILISMF